MIFEKEACSMDLEACYTPLHPLILNQGVERHATDASDFCGARPQNHNHLHPPILKSDISQLESTNVGGLFGTGYLVFNRRYLIIICYRIVLFFLI